MPFSGDFDDDKVTQQRDRDLASWLAEAARTQKENSGRHVLTPACDDKRSIIYPLCEPLFSCGRPPKNGWLVCEVGRWVVV